MNWFDLVDETTAKRQIAWERQQVIFRAINAGALHKFIARKLGVSRARIGQLYKAAQRPCPISSYCECHGEIEELVFKSRHNTSLRITRAGNKYYAVIGSKKQVVAGPFNTRQHAINFIENAKQICYVG